MRTSLKSEDSEASMKKCRGADALEPSMLYDGGVDPEDSRDKTWMVGLANADNISTSTSSTPLTRELSSDVHRTMHCF
jgi:hypothetical protein